ncbi:heme receptor [Bordetella pertussis]|uniref:TonB-dependent hemoglobin/transferrin/lactoferrin family receptor n=1 Tax=Bordetella pertussis TaxID=520 RepID=UPI0005E0BF5E|nr:TonB-dependent hemoglobin/transferrin/lactoferrin family receptor [Bordetella pertussis]CFN84222.1 heme receptor [Bordetella pertussis]
MSSPRPPAPWRAPLALAGLSLGCAAGAYGAPAPAQTVVTLPAQEVIGDSVAAARSVLRLPEIERAQADNFASLVDQLPGISMAGSPRPGGQSLNIWGMGDTEDVKIVLDGAPKGFEKYRQGSVFIEPELIRRIEVDKGPHNLVDGNGGFGGTVKIDTKDAADLLPPGARFGALAKYGRHSNDGQDIYSVALYGRTRADGADGLLYANRRDGGDLRRPDGTRFAYSRNNQRSLLAKVNLYPDDAQTITLSAMRSNAAGWQPFAAKRDDLPAPSQADIDRYGLTEAWRRKLVHRDQLDQNYSAKWNIAPSAHPWVNLTLAYARSDTRQRDRRSSRASQSAFLGTLGNKSWVDYRDDRFDLSNESHVALGTAEHVLLAGLRWHRHRRDTLMYYPPGRGEPDYNHGYFQPHYMPSGTQTVRSLYLQDAVTVGGLTVTPGVRYDHVANTGRPNDAPRYNNPAPVAGHDYRRVSYAGWTPHLGVVWKAARGVALFADAGRTWRAPVIDEQYEVQYAKSNVSGSSRALRPERIVGLRAGAVLDYNDIATRGDSVQIRTTLFRNRGKHEIFQRRGVACRGQAEGGAASDCPKPLSNYRNLPGYTIEGLELETYYDSPAMFASLSLSAMRGHRDASPRDPWGPRTWIAEIPPVSARAMLGVKLPRLDMVLGWRGEFVRRQDRSPTDGDPLAGYWALPKTAGYALHGLFASWQPRHVNGLDVRLAADNLFNRPYHPYLGEAVSGTGRNIKLSIAQRF